MVEFVLVAPIFFLLLFAIIEGGRFIFYYEDLNNATRAGARWAIVNGANAPISCPPGPAVPPAITCDLNGEQVKAEVRKAAFGVLGSGAEINVVWHDPANNLRGSTVTVSATYTYSPIIPLPLPPITVAAESSLVVNN